MTALPLTPPEHEHSAAVEIAARWYAALSAEERGACRAVPALRQRFGLTAPEACRAIALAAEIRAGRA